MASDGGLKVDNPGETVDSLNKEVETLKTRLEEERKKLNDVACKPFCILCFSLLTSHNIFNIVLV